MTAHHCPTGAHPEPDSVCYRTHRCRCFGCRLDQAAHIAAWRDGGAPRVSVPVEAARGLIAMLFEAGGTREWIAAESGVSERTLTGIRQGETRRCSRPTMRRLSDLARRVGSGDAIPPRYAESVPDPDVRCANYPRCKRDRDGRNRECGTCARRRRLAAA